MAASRPDLGEPARPPSGWGWLMSLSHICCPMNHMPRHGGKVVRLRSKSSRPAHHIETNNPGAGSAACAVAIADDSTLWAGSCRWLLERRSHTVGVPIRCLRSVSRNRRCVWKQSLHLRRVRQLETLSRQPSLCEHSRQQHALVLFTTARRGGRATALITALRGPRGRREEHSVLRSPQACHGGVQAEHPGSCKLPVPREQANSCVGSFSWSGRLSRG